MKHIIGLTTLLAIAAVLSTAHASPETVTLPEISTERGNKEAYTRLQRAVAEAKNEKKLSKELERLELSRVTMPVAMIAGADLVFSTPQPLTNCVWSDTLTCTFSVTVQSEIEATAYRPLCRTAFGLAAVIHGTPTQASENTVRWSVTGVEECWDMDGEGIVVGPVGAQDLVGIGKGTEFLPPELVEMSWREAEEIIQSKERLFRSCTQGASEPPQTKSGRLEIKYSIAENGSIASAEVLTATFEEQSLRDCLVKQFKRIQFRPPMGGFTNGTYTISFSQ